MLNGTYEKHRHLVGTKVCKWTILDIVEHRGKDKGYIYAKCQCECGTIKDVRLSKLLNNKCQDCGCGRKERQKEKMRKQYTYLIGATINDWTILDIIPADEEHYSTFALCECQCGTIREVNLTNITKGVSKNCGCGRKKTMSEKYTKNLVGQRFGKLVVLELLDERSSSGKTMYRCRCDCGNEVNVVGNSLTTYHTLSCGCLVSYWNMYIRQFLKENKIAFKPEHIIYVDNKYYRFDFHLPEYNLLIEYDGRQHYESVRFFGTEEDAETVLKKTQESDKIKNQYCKDNNINLLRIPYWETKNIETIINNYLQRLNEKGFVENFSTRYATV